MRKRLKKGLMSTQYEKEAARPVQKVLVSHRLSE